MRCPNCKTDNRPGAQFCAQCGYLLFAPRHPDGTIILGTVLDRRYRVCQLLGAGGYGAVYLADDLRLAGRQCAVKETLDTSPAARQLFTQEAQLLARLKHPQLVQVSDYFSTPADELFLVMDYIAGDDLAAVLARAAGFLPAAPVVAWMQQVCAVLSYMHTWVDPQTGRQTPIIHRDLKPSNIKLRADGTITVIDLGIAKIQQAGGKTLGAARAVTPPYSPPEQYGLGTDARSDVYALGVTLYELLTKQLPPEAPHRAYAAVRPPRQHNPQISAGLEQAILKAIAAHPDQRFQTAAELGAALPVGAGFTPAPRAPVKSTATGSASVGAGLTPVQGAPIKGAAPGALPSRITGQDGKEMILIPAGEFTMGSEEFSEEFVDDAQPVHTVHLDAYYIDRYPVTNAEYQQFVEATGHRKSGHWQGGKIPRGLENHPVAYVDWHDAAAYAKWAGKRLPTEAEWEKAARGTDGRRYPWGDEWDKDQCNTKESGIGGPTPVGKYSPAGDSPYGVADMAGNVWEWCADWYDENYYRGAEASTPNPQGPGSGEYRVARGGSYYSSKGGARCAGRRGSGLPPGPQRRVSVCGCGWLSYVLALRAGALHSAL